MKKHIDQLTQWLKNQVEQTKTNGLIVGVSGGVDSAVVSYLIEKATPGHALGVILPCHSSEEDLKDAQAVVEGAKINHMTIDLSARHRQLFEQIKQQTHEKQEWNEEKERIADANLRARLRMSTLYTLATNYNYLVVGTDNQSEWYTGYFTKYGDGGVDLAPLVHYTKTEIFEMARELGVPDSIITKSPSAGLWEGQTDEQEMGVSYETIDAYLRGKNVGEKERAIIEEMHERTEHKRQMPPTPPDFHQFS